MTDYSNFNTEESMLQPSSSVVNMLQSLPRSSNQETKNFDSHSSKISSQITSPHEMSFGVFKERDILKQNSSTYLHNRELVKNTLDKVTISSENDSLVHLPSVTQEERKPFGQRSVPLMQKKINKSKNIQS
jgi:hypothetical protein